MSPTRLLLEYLHPWPNAAGFYVAADHDWYRQAGIDLEIALCDPLRGDSLDYVLRGEADFAVFPSNRLFVRREHEGPVVGIAAINHGGMETIQTVTGTGVCRPRDLQGRRLAYNPTPRGVAMVRHLVAVDGGDPDDVITVDSGLRELTVDDIRAGEADATFGGYWAWDALFGSLPEDERVVWRVDDIGAPPYHGYLLGAHEQLVTDEPELARAFLAVTERGYRTAATNPGLALMTLERVIPYFPRQVLARSLRLVAQTWCHDGRWGVQRPELLAPYAGWLAEHGVIRSAATWAAATTNTLLPDGS